jgi:hypothetical protein
MKSLKEIKEIDKFFLRELEGQKAPTEILLKQ